MGEHKLTYLLTYL